MTSRQRRGTGGEGRSGLVDPRLVAAVPGVRRDVLGLTALGLAQIVPMLAFAAVVAGVLADITTRRHPADPSDLLVLAALLIIRLGIAWSVPVRAAHVGSRVKERLRSTALLQLLSDPRRGGHAGEVVALVVGEIDKVEAYVSRYVPLKIHAVVVPVVVIAAVATRDVLSAVVLLVTVPLVPLLMALVGSSTSRRTARRWEAQRRLSRYVADLVSGLPTLQVFGRARAAGDGMADADEKLRVETMATLRLAFLSSLTLDLFATLSVAVVAVEVGLRLLSGHLALAPAFFVLVLAPEVFWPLRRLGAAYHEATDGMTAVDAVLTRVATTPVGAGSPARVTDTSLGTSRRPLLSVSGVGFSRAGGASDARRTVLQNVAFDVEPGAVVLVNGPSGSGKTTLLHLILGVERLGTGTISAVGLAQSATLPTTWRRHIAWVSQHPAILAGTIAENVALGEPGADERAVVDALAAVGAADLEPDRRVGPDGAGLSAGEARRVALARALLRLRSGARLLLVDEPTTELDPATEAVVVDALRREVRRLGAGAVVVSHSDQLVGVADRVVTLLNADRSQDHLLPDEPSTPVLEAASA